MPESEIEDKALMGNLNLSPSKHPMSNQNAHGSGVGGAATRPFVPGHRRAKSDGCGMFFYNNKKQEYVQDEKFRANYRYTVWKFHDFLPLKFFVKSILGILGVRNLPLNTFRGSRF